MFKIRSKEQLSPEVIRMVVEAPAIATRRKPGQFVIVMANERSERMPLTICDADAKTGTITLIFQVVGGSTRDLGALKEGEDVAHITGPLGKPTKLGKVGTVCAVGGGVGIALLYPIAKGFKEAGNKLISVLGARTKDLLILQKEMTALSDETMLCTDDGSLGRKAMVTALVDDILGREEKPNEVVVVGPGRMMQAVCEQTRKLGISTIVSLNPIMVDGTGMCGGCRVSVGGETKFACVDGPEFDGHKVDFEELIQRQSFYRGEESEMLRHREEECKLKGVLGDK
jgi:ferredoxin/flavodoxin---NADP+ reductase